MRVIGVDPGLTRCGIGVVDAGRGRTLSLVHVAVATTASDMPTPERLAAIAAALDAAIAEHRPDALAVERVFAQHNVRTVMGTAQASGLAMVAAVRAGIPVATYTPSEVKAAVTGHGRADKAQVGFMVAKMLGLADVPKPADAADALAIAITHAVRGASAGHAAQAPGHGTTAQRAWAEAERAARRRH